MKPSEILQNALDNFYGMPETKINGRWAEEYMCHAIALVDCSLQEQRNCKATFMPILESEDTQCLTVYLKDINYEGKYHGLVCRYGHDTPSTYKLRVKWWNDHIAKLKEQGQ